MGVFIDYISLMLINMVGGLAVLAIYLLSAATRSHARGWSAAFAVPGAVAFVTGLHMTLTWPIADLSKVAEGLPNLQFANVAFGEMSVMFGALFLAASVAMAKDWSLLPVSIYALVAGAGAIVIGIIIWRLGLTRAPFATAAGFVLTGLGGVLMPLAIGLRKHFAFRLVTAVALLAGAAIWAYTAWEAYWDHLQRFSTAAT